MLSDSYPRGVLNHDRSVVYPAFWRSACPTGRERLIPCFRTQQTGALLAFLAYHCHQSHSRETLIELFWPEREPETGWHNLSNALSSLRNQLEPPGVLGGSCIIADRFSVELNPEAFTTDVAEFEQAFASPPRPAPPRTSPNGSPRQRRSIAAPCSPITITTGLHRNRSASSSASSRPSHRSSIFSKRRTNMREP